jgi:hypothetical protein
MIDEIKSLMDSYVGWLRDKTTLRPMGEIVEITTPFLDRHNDYLQIYASRSDGQILLTDDGYVLDDLLMSGCRLDSKKRQNLLKITLNGFGVQQEGNALRVAASTQNFAIRKHNLIQAMLAVNDMFYLAAPTVSSLFLEDVTAWLDSNEIRYVPSVKFTGKSQYDHIFDFAVPKSKRQPERLIRAINRPSRETAEVLAFAWVDTREARPPDSQAYAILNDSEQPVSAAIASALGSYEVHAIPWSKRESVLESIAA